MKQPGPEPRYQVLVLVNGHQEMRDVTVGINNKIYTEITSGLNEGDQVIVGMPSSGGTMSSRMGPPRMF